jgi:hypothetical protein
MTSNVTTRRGFARSGRRCSTAPSRVPFFGHAARVVCAGQGRPSGNPRRVEYDLTPFGRRFVAILDQIAELDGELSGHPSPDPGRMQEPGPKKDPVFSRLCIHVSGRF